MGHYFLPLFSSLYVLIPSPPLPDLAQAGFEEVQKLNQQNNQLSQCTTETAAGTAAHLDLIEEEQKGESYKERKDDKQQAAVEDEAREQEIDAELLQIKEEDKKEEEESSKKEEAIWLSEESQLAAPNSSGQTDESITVTPDRFIHIYIYIYYVFYILFSK